MSIKQICVLIFLFFLSKSAFSLSKPLPGYIVRLNGDTVHCQIEYSDWRSSPNTIQVDMNSSTQEFGPQDIKAFGIDGFGNYISAMVNYHTNPISGFDLPDHFSDSTVSKPHFLKVLTRGYYSLYNLLLPERTYFFISVRDSAVSELVYRAKRINDSIVYDPSYIIEISRYFEKEGILYNNLNKVNSAKYYHTDLQELISILNEKYSGNKYNVKSVQRLELQAFIGGIRNSFSGDIIYDDNAAPAHFPATYTLGGGLNLLYTFKGHFNAIKVRLSVGYNGYSNHITTPDNAYTLTSANSIIQSNLYLMYLFNPLDKTNFYMKGGVGYNNSVNTDMNIYRNGTHPVIETNVSKNFISYMLSAGVSMGRSSFEFSFSPYTQLADPGNTTYGPPGKNFKLSTMAVYYYFSIFPWKK